MFGNQFSNWGPAGDFPDVGNTLSDDTTNGSAGTYVGPDAGDVRSGTQYGAGGTEFTGTLAVTGEEGIFFLDRRP